MPLEGGVYGKQDGLPLTNFHRFRYRTKAATDLRLTPAECILVTASVVDCSGCSERDEDAGSRPCKRLLKNHQIGWVRSTVSTEPVASNAQIRVCGPELAGHTRLRPGHYFARTIKKTKALSWLVSLMPLSRDIACIRRICDR